ncbi:MAG: DUF6339 family protein [Blastocatellia bacterium]|jgi:hypothetical protein
MRKDLHRLQSPISDQGLIEALRSGKDLPVIRLTESIDLRPLDEVIQEVTEQGIRESALDSHLVEPLHRSLRDLDESLKTDMRIWHWLTVVRYPDVVWLRWRGSVPSDPEEGFMTGNGHRPVPAVRFLGTPSINGHGRNTFARLFFAAERLISSDGNDYDLVRRLFSSQELHLGLSDREYGLLPKVNRVLTRELADLPDLKVRAGIRRLNAIGGSLCLDLLEEDKISELVREELEEAAS